MAARLRGAVQTRFSGGSRDADGHGKNIATEIVRAG
jgi:hypothetical protein